MFVYLILNSYNQIKNGTFAFAFIFIWIWILHLYGYGYGYRYRYRYRYRNLLKAFLFALFRTMAL